MKPNKASLLLPLLAILFLLTLNGCYTQLAYVARESGSTDESSTVIIYEPATTVYVPVTTYEPPPPPVFYSLPSAGSTSTISEPLSQPQTRNSGYQRSESSHDSQPDNNRRTSGSTRGGR